MSAAVKTMMSGCADRSGEPPQAVRRSDGQPYVEALAAVIEDAVVTRLDRWAGDRHRRCGVLLGEGRVRALVGGLIPLGTQLKVSALAEVHARIGLQADVGACCYCLERSQPVRRSAMRYRRIRRAVTDDLPVERASVVVAAIEDSPTAVPVARWAGEVARAAGGEIVVFVAQPVLPEIHGPAGMGRQDGSEAVRQEAAATVGRVQPVLESMGVSFRVEVRPCVARRWAAGCARQAAKALLRASRDAGADLIIIGQPPARRHMRSSVAARVVQRAGCDVLVVPRGLPAADVDEERRPGVGERLAS